MKCLLITIVGAYAGAGSQGGYGYGGEMPSYGGSAPAPVAPCESCGAPAYPMKPVSPQEVPSYGAPSYGAPAPPTSGNDVSPEAVPVCEPTTVTETETVPTTLYETETETSTVVETVTCTEFVAVPQKVVEHKTVVVEVPKVVEIEVGSCDIQDVQIPQNECSVPTSGNDVSPDGVDDECEEWEEVDGEDCECDDYKETSPEMEGPYMTPTMGGDYDEVDDAQVTTPPEEYGSETPDAPVIPEDASLEDLEKLAEQYGVDVPPTGDEGSEPYPSTDPAEQEQAPEEGGAY